MEDLEWFNPVARAANVWTMARLTQENFGYLRGLPAGPLAVEDFQLIHGSPMDEDEYLMSVYDARNVFPYLEANLAFFGHTHLQGGYAWLNAQYRVLGRMEFFQTELWERLDADGSLSDESRIGGAAAGWRWAGGVRAVRQPAREVLYRRVPYDVAETQRKIEAAGLPDVLGSRLSIGR